MKKIIFSFLVSFLFFVGVASAQIGMMGNYWQSNTLDSSQYQELNSVLQNIYNDQGVSTQSEVDCGKITDDQFDILGDAYMGVMLPNENQHEAMDVMMGGEGSESLRQAHINMGRSYLGCWSNYNSGPVYMPMMGGYGIIGDNDVYGNYYSHRGFGWPSMMGGYYGQQYGWSGWIINIIFWILVIIGIVSLVRWLRKHKK